MLQAGPILLIALALFLPLFYILRSRPASPTATATPRIVVSAPDNDTPVSEEDRKQDEPMSVMQPPRADLAQPKDDLITVQELKQFDGSDPSKPIYVAIKGTVFDVSHKRDTYGKGKSYNLFAGKDASKALGMSSLKEEDAISDYSGLSDTDMKTLNDWHDFFSKRYNIIGRVVGLPAPANPSASNL